MEKLLEETQRRPGKGKLAFVGDGINDAPVLTRADIGIAMGAMGSDAAIEAADVVLMDDKPSNIARAMRIARKTMGIVWQNIVFALGVKFLVLILAAVGIANMWLAVFADVGVAVIAILNAMRGDEREEIARRCVVRAEAPPFPGGASRWEGRLSPFPFSFGCSIVNILSL